MKWTLLAVLALTPFVVVPANAKRCIYACPSIRGSASHQEVAAAHTGCSTPCVLAVGPPITVRHPSASADDSLAGE